MITKKLLLAITYQSTRDCLPLVLNY